MEVRVRQKVSQKISKKQRYLNQINKQSHEPE